MKLSELKQFLDSYPATEKYDTWEVVIPVKVAGSIAGQPSVKLKSLTFGFDWDSGKIFLTPEKELRECDRDELAAIQKKLDDMGWDFYENGNLKRENKKLKARIKELESQ